MWMMPATFKCSLRQFIKCSIVPVEAINNKHHIVQVAELNVHMMVKHPGIGFDKLNKFATVTSRNLQLCIRYV